MTVTGLKALLDMHNHEDELWIGNPKLPRKELESQVEKILTENPDAIHKLDYRESFFKAKYQTKYRLLLRKAKITQRRTRKSRTSTVETPINVANTGKTFPEWHHHENAGTTKIGTAINSFLPAPCNTEIITDDKKMLVQSLSNDTIHDDKILVTKGGVAIQEGIKLKRHLIKVEPGQQQHASSPIMVASRGILEGHGGCDDWKSDYTGGRGIEGKVYSRSDDGANRMVVSGTTVPTSTVAAAASSSIVSSSTSISTTTSQDDYCPSMDLTNVTVNYPTCDQVVSNMFPSDFLNQLPLETEVPFPCGIELSGTDAAPPIGGVPSYLGNFQSAASHGYNQQPVVEADWFGSTLMYCGDQGNDWNYNLNNSDGWNYNV